ncbi:bifunctional cytochrome P450/NADPH--P450 reductase [Paenibacillus beijingensis]|uniref:Bifunctional cytochrome P450/NADPH--P450 reductase n=1 Tax=Paenibacillus beijingensis TaxID=1126833 RepID=A0A0D5NK70_9BACL|nr:bifunctional cytochrome P450/NADPH--P450 reductase [Paenibacillus beijingensis]AJY75535.1 NADPH--cytochrome P450 reductase [Paenibacillus beijingensis]
MSETITVPLPKMFGPLGNLPLLDKETPMQSIAKIADELGPIFRLELPGRSDLWIWGHELVKDACDESRFDKYLPVPLQKLRPIGGDGLFTSWTDEPNWKKAHNILLPSFSQRAMQGYHAMMADIALQLIQKWSRLNPDESIDVPEDMTRLTLDTIGLCGFGYRFNSYYRDNPHPFIVNMVRALTEGMEQSQRLSLQDKLMVMTKRQFKLDIQSMFSLVDKIIAERKESGSQDAQDLLSRMLRSKDPETGETLSEENIRYQIITFLIAGHETTSGLLSFSLYFLLKNPDKLRKAYEEVDRVLTEPVPTYNQVRSLKYIRMILDESLRLWPTAPIFSLYAKEDTMLGGVYSMKKGEGVNVLLPKLHRDTAVWGDDAEAFRPERFENPSLIPQHAYKPFGNGMRACIGMQFSLHEATMVLGMILRQFEIIDHTNYQLKVKETLTLKPQGLTMRVRPRAGQPIAAVALKEEAPDKKMTQPVAASSAVQSHNTPLLVLYGSNLGTAEGIARELADAARYQGFRTEVAPLDERIGKLPTEGAVLIVAASYNGKPADNARGFVQWLEQAEPDAVKGVRYAVFGCGDRNWAVSYQQVPRLIDRQLDAKGASRLTGIGEGDASDDFEKQLDDWRNRMWPDMMGAFDLTVNENAKQEPSTLTVRLVSGPVDTPLAESYDAFFASVLDNRELQSAESGRSTRHLEFALPEGAAYQEGDHLGVFPHNHPDLVERVLRRYELNGSDYFILSASTSSAAHLPLDRPVNVRVLLSRSVELQEAATRAQLRELASYTVCPPHKRELEALLQEDAYKTNVLEKRLTMLDLLEQYPACEMPFERFLELLPPLKARYYSISSSSRVQPDRASITVGVVSGPARSGRGEYRGVASNYLAGRLTGDSVALFVRRPESGFQLPDDPMTPIIMVGPGTGIAPFRGFLQARRALVQEGREVGEAHLYFGCRNPHHDYLYQEELASFEREGLVTLHTAFSRVEGKEKRYVQHLIRQDAGHLIRLLDQGGRLYICGDGSRMAPDVEAALRSAYGSVHGGSERDAQLWLDQIRDEGRYAKDVWAGV